MLLFITLLHFRGCISEKIHTHTLVMGCNCLLILVFKLEERNREEGFVLTERTGEGQQEVMCKRNLRMNAVSNANSDTVFV